MASNATIAHRFANKDNNFERGLKGSSVHIEGRNYYSYSTVFGQWVDKKVCLVYHGETSITSNGHKLWDGDFPKDVTLFPYDDGGRGPYYNNWHGCDLLGWRGEFDYDARVRLMDYWVGEIYDALNAMVGGKKKDLDSNATIVIAEYWAYVEKLCSMYKDTSVPKWLKKKRIDMDGMWKKKKVVVKALYNGERGVEALVDAAFGLGTYKKYYNYCARYRKAADKRAKVEVLCERLGIASPYESWSRGRMDTGLTADQIRKLSAKERLDLHFASIMRDDERKEESAVEEKYNKNFRNAYKWIVGFEPKEKWNGYEKDVHNNCINKDNGVVYECSGEYIYGFYWCDTSVAFNYDSFRKSEDKEQWIAGFYAKCKEAAMNRKAICILKRINAHKKEKEHSYDDDVYLNDDYLRESTTEPEYIICSEFIDKQDKHYADEEARKRAQEIERQRQAEERRREEEYRAKVKQEQIDACLSRGTEGARDLWRLHLAEIYKAEGMNDTIGDKSHDDFFLGGNVLLRLNLDKTHVESSKGVRVPVAVAKLWFKKVKQWHDDPKSFKPIEWNTKGNGTYTVSEYKNDILTAGCHDIAYAEMERMYNEIVSLGI
jgi:hypothetical protein